MMFPSFNTLGGLILLFLSTLQTTTAHPSPSRSPTVLHHFAPPTWNENLALFHPSSHHPALLITQIITPTIQHISLSPPYTTQFLTSFPPYAGVLGITKTSPTQFYVVVGNFSLSPLDLGIGTYSIFSLDLEKYSEKTNTGAVTKHIASLPDAGLVNGLTTWDREKGLLLAADSTFGIIWLINVKTGQVSKFLEEVEMKPPAGQAFGIGINGVHTLPLFNKTLGKGEEGREETEIYFSNTALSSLYRVPISRVTGKKTGPVELVYTGVAIDDFALDAKKGAAYLACGGVNEVRKVVLKGKDMGKVDVVFSGAGNGTETGGWGPTSVVLGRGGERIYVTTDGGLAEGGKGDGEVIEVWVGR